MWVDPLLTLLIAAYTLWQVCQSLPQAIHVLMEGAPADRDMDDLVATVEQVDGVIELHHLYVWELDEHHRAMEAHVAIKDGLADDLETTKSDIKRCLADKFQIQHSTLEFEYPDSQHNNCTDSFLIYQH